MEKEKLITFNASLFDRLLYANYTNEIDSVVDIFLEEISHFFSIDCAELYIPTDNLLILRGVYGINRYYVCKLYYEMAHPVVIDHYRNKKVYVGDNVNYSDFDEFSNFKSKLTIPIYFSSTPFGVLVIRTRDEKKDYLSSIIDNLMQILKHFAIYANDLLQRKIYNDKDNQLKYVRELYVRFSDIDKYKEVLDSLAFEVTRIFSSRKAFVRVKYNLTGKMFTRSAYGIYNDFNYDLFENNLNLIDLEKDGVTIINDFKRYSNKDLFLNIVETSVMYVPLIKSKEIIGYIVVADRIPDAVNPLGFFTQTDRELLHPLSSNIANNISEKYNINLLKLATEKNAKHTERLNKLYEIGNILLEHSKTDDILYFLLSITTIGDVFGFNRAFAFLYDKTFNIFRGRMCIAPSDQADAGNIWHRMEEQNQKGLREKLLVSLLQHLSNKQNQLQDKVINTIIPNDEKCKLFFDAFTKKKYINIKDVNDPDAEALRKYSDFFGMYPFALIPIENATDCIGMIVVDNPYNSKIIPDDDLDFIRMFGKQAGLSLEYSNLYNEIEKNNIELKKAQQNLLEAQHLSLVAEMSSSIAHNLRNFAVPIAGFANRLTRISNDERVINYAKVIVNEVEKLETYVKKNLSFAKNLNLEIESLSINNLLSSLSMLANEHIEKSGKKIFFYTANFSSDDNVSWDYAKIHEALLDLIVNAVYAIENEKKAIISIIATDNIHASNVVELIIENTNSFIDDEVKPKIFTPFYTTKSHGTGLGLATCKRIVEAHGGSIVVNTKKLNDTSAVCFYIDLQRHVE